MIKTMKLSITISFAILSSTWEACIAMATNY
jgi:hypothetical protein